MSIETAAEITSRHKKVVEDRARATAERLGGRLSTFAEVELGDRIVVGCGPSEEVETVVEIQHKKSLLSPARDYLLYKTEGRRKRQHVSYSDWVILGL